MMLRTRISIMVSLALLFLAAGLIWTGLLRERVSVERLDQVYVHGQSTIWDKILEVKMNQMATVAGEISARPGLVAAAEAEDQAALTRILQPVTATLDQLRLANRVEVVNTAGDLLFTTQGVGQDVTSLDAGLLRPVLEEGQNARTIQQDPSRQFLAVIARPILAAPGEQRQSQPVVGAIILTISLEVPLQELKHSLGAETFIINRRGRLVHGTDRALWQSLHEGALVRQNTRETQRLGDRFYALVTVPLEDGAGRSVAYLVTITDDTANLKRRELISTISISVAAAGFLILLIGLYLYMRKAFHPLNQAIEVLESLSQGDTSVAIEAETGRDEIGSIAQAVAVFREHAIMLQRVEQQKERHRQRREQLMALKQELDIAHKMQQSILPSSFPRDPAYQIHAMMKPAKGVGGDFYDFFKLRDGEIGLVVADVSGKGMGAALFMAVARTVLKATALTGLPPGECLTAVNNLLAEENDQNMFVTLFYGILNVHSGTLTYANGGHNPPYLLRRRGSLEQVPGTDGMALAIMEDMPYDQASLEMAPGDSLLLYTDGITEAFNAEGEEFGEARLEKALSGLEVNTAKALVSHIDNVIADFARGAEQSDDLTLLVTRYDQKL